VDPASKNNYAIRVATLFSHKEVVQLLLKDERVDPAAQYNQAIRYATEDGHKEVVQLLLQDDRVDPAADNNYAIRHAAKNGHKEVVQFLLQDDRVDPVAKDNQAIRFAAKNGHKEVVQVLLEDDRVHKFLWSTKQECLVGLMKEFRFLLYLKKKHFGLPFELVWKIYEHSGVNASKCVLVSLNFVLVLQVLEWFEIKRDRLLSTFKEKE
jgi:hypothetical protein